LNQWLGRMLLGPGPGLATYTGPGGHSDQHAHHAVQFGVALDEPLRVTIGTMSLTATAVLIPPDVPHSFAVNGRVLFLWVDPHGPRGHRLKEHATRLIGRDLALHLRGLGEIASGAGLSTDLVRALLAAISGEFDELPKQPSPPVAAAVAYVESAIERGDAERRAPSLDEAARAAGVSPSRLTHVFTAEVGIPFRRYVLWVRLMRAIRAIAAGNDVTRAAGDAGFSDSAHLSRTFRRIFGLPPSLLLAIDLVEQSW